MFPFFKNEDDDLQSGRKDPANIVRTDQNNAVQVSKDFPSIPVANHALSVHAAQAGYVTETGENEYGGKTATVLEQTGPRKFGQVDYEVFPKSVIDGTE